MNPADITAIMDEFITARNVAELHARFGESEKLEMASINPNLRGLGYGG